MFHILLMLFHVLNVLNQKNVHILETAPFGADIVLVSRRSYVYISQT